MNRLLALPLLLPILAPQTHTPNQVPMALVETYPGFPKPPGAFWGFPLKVVFPNPVTSPGMAGPIGLSLYGYKQDTLFNSQAHIAITTTGPGGAATLPAWYYDPSHWIYIVGGEATVVVDTTACLPGQIVTIETYSPRLGSARSSFRVY